MRTVSTSRPRAMLVATARLVPTARLGTALGLMWAVQSAAMAGANLMAGWLNDTYGASALNPAGYQPMMRYFFLSGALGFLFATMLWRAAGRRHHESLLRGR